MFGSFFNFLQTGLRVQIRNITAAAIRAGINDALGDIQNELMASPVDPQESIEAVEWNSTGKNKQALQRQAWLSGVSHQGTIEEIKGRLGK